MIKLLQEWRWTALMPPRLHDWHMFIRPAELRQAVGTPRSRAWRDDRAQASG